MWIILTYVVSVYIIFYDTSRQKKCGAGAPVLESASLKWRLNGLYILILSLFFAGFGWVLYRGIDIKVIDFLDVILSGIAIGVFLTALITFYVTHVLKVNIAENNLHSLIGTSLCTLSLFGMALIHFVNITFDKNPETQIIVLVKNKSHSKGRYDIVVDSWGPSPRPFERFRVPKKLYQKVAIGDELSVAQKPGFLGIRWVKDWSVTVQREVQLKKTMRPLPSDFNNRVIPPVQSIER